MDNSVVDGLSLDVISMHADKGQFFSARSLPLTFSSSFCQFLSLVCQLYVTE